MGNDKGDTIAQSALKCLEIFKRLPHRQPGDDDTLQAFDLPEDAIVDAQARFRTWIENIGALQRGKASLDDRLGHADVRAEVLRLLGQLLLSLTDFWHIVSGSRSQQTWTSSNESGSLDFSDDEDSDEDDEDDDLATETSSGASSAPTTESHLLYHSILEAITSLLKLSMFIRRSARGNKFVRSSAAQKYETQYDIIHVRDRYPYASENTFLIERLGKANAQRRQWLSYKKRHRDKLALAVYPEIEDLSSEQIPFSEVDTSTDMHDHGEEEDLRPFAQVPELEPDLATTLSSTKASTFYQRDERERAISETDVSETSYSESRYGDIGQETNLVPQPPSESVNENPFECPYCFSIITVAGSHSWTKHVHSDLASYVCTQENCNHPLFESRKHWFSHELEEHRRQWVCNICDERLPSVQLFEEHMKAQHSGNFLESQLPALTGRSARPLQRIKASACPLCDYETMVRRKLDLGVANEPVTVSIQAFRNHLGRHLEQLALFVLPKTEVMEQTDNDAKSDVANEGEGVMSGQAADSDDSEAVASVSDPEQVNTPSNSDLEGNESTLQMVVGADISGMTPKTAATILDDTNLKSILGTEDTTDDIETTPDLAFVWMPPMDFTPPEAYFEVDDEELVPRREEPMFGGDIYTPGWVRGYGKHKEAFCGRCSPGVWHNIEDLSYENNLTYAHGIASTGLSLPRPSSLRQIDGKPGAWQGYCEACLGWRNLKKSSAGWNWFRHWVKEHGPPKTKNSPAYLHPQSASFSRVNAKDVVRLVQTIRTNAFSNFKSVLSQQPRLASSSDYSGRLPLQYAAELGDIDFMQHLLDIYVQSRTRPDPVSFVNEASAKGETALMLAVSQGNEAAVKWLIENQVDVNAADTNGSTALDNAAEAGYVRLAQMLLSHGARPEKAKRYQQTRLRNAALIQKRATNFETIQGLPTETNPVLEDITSLSSLHKAALEGNTDGIKLALVEGVDLEEHATDGRTPLMLAASRGHREAISTLVAAGANIDATSSKGWTTLMNSVRNKNAPVVELLISNGADVNHLSPDRWTALAEAAAQSQTDIMKLLLDCGADPETRSSHDWTPLMHSAYKGDEAAVDLLLNAGADINVTSQHDETALLLAAAGGYARIVRTLLDAGCDPEPLWAKDLYESSTGINDKPGAKKADLVAGLGILEGPEDRAHAQGWTPLMLACQGGHEEIVQMLLYQDVRLEVKSPHGKTAVDIAKENGRMKVARMLDERERQSGNTV